MSLTPTFQIVIRVVLKICEKCIERLMVDSNRFRRGNRPFFRGPPKAGEHDGYGKSHGCDSSLHGDLIGIGAAVTHRPLPHHRAYGSVHGGSSGYANTPRLMTEDRASGSTHSRARRTELWTGRGTKGHDRCQPYYSPAAPRPPAGSVPPGDGAVFSTAATERPVAAAGPSGSD